MKKNMHSPFPQALRGKKKITNQTEILEVLRQVTVNMPLLDMIKHIPSYEKILKELCTVKKGLDIEKKSFLTEQVSSIIQSKTPMKYKDPGSPTISVNIGGTCIDKALLDLGASVNLLPYSVFGAFNYQTAPLKSAPPPHPRRFSFLFTFPFKPSPVRTYALPCSRSLLLT